MASPSVLVFLPLDILSYTSNSPTSNCNISIIKTHSEYRLYNNFFNLATIFSSQFYSKLHTYILFNIMQIGVHHNLPKHNHKWSFIFTVLNILYTDISNPGDTPLSCEHPLFFWPTALRVSHCRTRCALGWFPSHSPLLLSCH